MTVPWDSPRKEEVPTGMESLEYDKSPRAGSAFCCIPVSTEMTLLPTLDTLCPESFAGSIGVCFHIVTHAHTGAMTF